MTLVMVLNDGETYSDLAGCRIIEVEATIKDDDIESAIENAQALKTGEHYIYEIDDITQSVTGKVEVLHRFAGDERSVGRYDKGDVLDIAENAIEKAVADDLDTSEAAILALKEVQRG